MEVTFAKDNKQNNSFLDKVKGLFGKVKTWKIPNAFYYFLILVAIGIGFYIMMLFENGFTLAYGGDYSAQYIPMGYHIWDYYHEWIKTGHFTLFDPTIYLGVNSLGSNAYYGLFSPFNIIIVILPRTIVPYSIAICSIVKLACAGLFFSFYVQKSFKVKENVSRICGIAYAFCGWCAFYLWYNNYQDILVFFPIVLMGIEAVLQEKKPWILCVGVFFLTICNYVLMVPYIICAFFYAAFRFFQRIRLNTAADNFKIIGFGFIGFAGGLLMSLFIFAPAFMATLSSPKLDSYSYFGVLKQYLTDHKFKEFFELLFSWKVAPDQHGHIIPLRVLYPIIEFFFPPDTCRTLSTLEITEWDFDDMAVSLWCYVPFIMFLVPALIQSGKEKKWSVYIGLTLLLLALFTPFMYYLTMGMTNGYARWTLFIPACLIAYVGIYLDKIPNVAKWHIHIGFAFAVIGIVAAWIVTAKLDGQVAYSKREFVYRFIYYYGNNKSFDFTNIAFICELVYVSIVYLVLLILFNKKYFHTLATIFVAAEAIAVGNFVTLGHGYDQHYNNGYVQNERFRNDLLNVQKNDKSYYRIFSSINDGYSENNGFMNGYSSANFFHSLYNYEIDDFTLWTGLRSWSASVGGNYRGKYQDLDNLLGVKYYFISKNKSQYQNIEQYNPGQYMANVPLDFTEYENYDREKSDYIIYENKNMSSFGYSYSSLFTGKMYRNYTDVTLIRNAMYMSKYGVVSNEDAEEIVAKYNDISLEGTPGSYPALNAQTNTLKRLDVDTDYKVAFYDVHKDVIENGKTVRKRARDYKFEDISNITEDYDEITYTGHIEDPKDSPSRDVNKAMNFYAFYLPKTEGEPLFKAGTSLYFQPSSKNEGTFFDGSVKYTFYFIDKNNKIFMCDAHDDDTTDNTAQVRAFYLQRDVYKLAVCPKFSRSFFNASNILPVYSESKDDYEARKATLEANPITNVKYSSDKFTFDTNFSNNRFVISRVPFDKGWKVNAINNSTGKKNDIKVYKGNGGFVSFVAPSGNYSYVMTYETPYLTISYIFSALSITGFFTSLVGYHIYQERKKKHYLDEIFREN